MALPAFNEVGDLPPGVHPATIEEVIDRFGTGSLKRREIATRLVRIYQMAQATSHLDRLIIFGSYVSSKTEPNDVDVVLVMKDEFRLNECPTESLALFDHARADDELGASVFWIRPAMLFRETLEQFLLFWQSKRDGTSRGVVEIIE